MKHLRITVLIAFSIIIAGAMGFLLSVPGDVEAATSSGADDAAVPLAPQAVPMTPTIALQPLGTFETGIFDESAAEIVAHDPVSQTLYVVNGEDETIDVIDINDPTAPTRIRQIDLSDYGDGPNSCDFHTDTAAGGLLAVAVEGDEVDEPGTLAFFDRDGEFVYSATVGILPDMVIFTPDGSKVLVANEGEPDDEYSVDPEGTVSIVSVGATSATVETAGFTAFNDQKQALIDSGVRIFGGVETFTVTAYSDTDPAALTLGGDVDAEWENGWLTIFTGDDPVAYQIDGVVMETDTLTLTTDFDGDTDTDVLTDTGTVNVHTGASTVAQDLEPEYIAVSPDGATAWVTLQENNAVAVVDIDSSSVVTVTALGFKDHSLAGNGLDASDEDGGINVAEWPLLGMYQPDAIASYEADGSTYYVTANEGDSREYDYFNEEVGIDDIVLDSAVFSATLQDEENLGELATTNTLGDTDGDGDFDVLYSYGARSFSIWADDGSLAYDSGDDLEQLTAARYPQDFNSDNDENDSFDKRSDNKGPEPEAITTGVIDGRTYAFIGLERMGGIAVYDVTDPTAPFLVWYVNNRHFGGDAEAGTAGDLGPEGLRFIPADQSPTGTALLAVANEVSGSTTIYEITDDIPYQLTVLHTNDVHGRVDEWESWGSVYGGSARISTAADQFRAAQDNVLLLDAGDQFQGTLYYRLFKADIVTVTMNALGYDAMAVGNHEFDDGPGELARLIDGADFPVLSANIDASAEPLLVGKIAPSTVVTVSDEPIGIVGLTTPETENISSPGDNVVFSDTTTSAQAAVDELKAQGIDKIIALTHLGYNEDVALAEAVSGIDVIVGGHSHTYLHTADEDSAGPYPTVVGAPDGDPVLVVTANEWGKYLGYLDVTFDVSGTVSSYSGYPILMDDSVAQDPTVQAIITPTYKVPVQELMNTYVGTTTLELPLSVGGENICRSRECLLGNLVTDAMLWKVNTLNPDDPYDVVFQNGGGLRAPIDAGEVSVGEVLEVLPFGNTIATFEITGTHVIDALENGVSKVGGTSGTGRFPQVAGMRYTYDPNEEIGSRIISVEVLSGSTYAPIDENAVYRVVTNNFMRAGGDGYDMFNELAIDPYDGGPPLEDAVMDYLEQFSPVTPEFEGRINPPNLQVTKQVTPTTDVEPGSFVTYTISLSNIGSGDALDVVITDTLPTEVSFGGWVQQGSASLELPPAGDSIVWGPWTVGSDSSETFVFTATVTDTVSYGAEVTNTVEFASENAAIGSSDAVFAIKGAPVITADFSADPLTGTVPLTVTFTDESTNATSWLWDFGDHMTSTEQNPTHTYTEVGVYIAALTVTNAAGSDTEVKQAYIVAGSSLPQPPTPTTTTLTSPDQPIFVNFDEPVITSTVRFSFTPTVTFTPTWGVAMTAQGVEASQADLYWGVTLDHEPFSETVTYTLRLLPGARTVAGADIPEGIIDTFEYQPPKRYIYLPLVMKN